MLYEESNIQLLKRFRDFLRDPKQLAALFEAFVRNFYRKEQKVFKVTADNLTWQDMHSTEEHMNLVPTMRFDICLRDESRYIVIDTKFYENALSEYYGKKGIRSQHLYQLFSYIKNLESKQVS